MLKNDFFFENFKSYDTIIPVPISPIRKKERGYNQSLLIAKELVKQIHQKYSNSNIQLDLKYLYKFKNIVPQSTLNKQDRLENVKDVYHETSRSISFTRRALRRFRHRPQDA